MGGGELGNFIGQYCFPLSWGRPTDSAPAAFGFAPTSLVSPLGAVSVVMNSLLSLFFLKEPFRLRDLIGCACTIGGGIVLVLFSPDENVSLTCDMLLYDYMAATPFLVYIGLLVGATVIDYLLARRWGTRSSIFFLLLCSFLGRQATSPSPRVLPVAPLAWWSCRLLRGLSNPSRLVCCVLAYLQVHSR